MTDHRGLYLLGLEWMEELNLLDEPINHKCSKSHVKRLSESSPSTTELPGQIAELRRRYEELFKPGLGCCSIAQAVLNLKADSKPVFVPDIEQLEYLCEKLYTTDDAELRTQAEKACSSLCERPDCLSLCQLLLQRSAHCYAQLVAATALTKYVSNRDAIIPFTTRLELRDYVLNYLAAHVGLEKFVNQALITLVCRLTKSGWFDISGEDGGFRNILTYASKFIESGQSGAILVGVHLLNSLVSEMNQTTESDMTRVIFLQRKLAASFRDSLLLPILRLSLSLLREADKNIPSLDFNNPEQSFQRENTDNSLHYLLALWQRLVASIPYVQSPDSNLLENAASQVTSAYIEACLASVTQYVNSPTNIQLDSKKSNKSDAGHSSWAGLNSKSSARGDEVADDGHDDECPLDNLTTLLQQLEQFAIIGRCKYSETCGLITRVFDEAASSYEKALNMASQGSTLDANLIRVIRLEEHRLAWLVYMVGALIGSRVNNTTADDDDFDGELVCRVLQLVRLTTNRMTMCSGLSSTNSPGSQNSPLVSEQLNRSSGACRLEMATLSFFEQFRRMYVGESVGRVSRVHQRLADVLGISDDLTVLGVFANKVVTNLKYWTENEPILNRTLNLLSELSRGYTAMRKLLRLEDIQFMLTSHTEENFPFLTTRSDFSSLSTNRQTSVLRLRTTFYTTLARLLMVELGEDENRFLNFMAPLTRNANQLIVALLSGSPSHMTPDQIKNAVVGLARDLRGLSSSLNTKPAYQMLLDWFYPSGFKLCVRALELWALDPLVNASVLKLVGELIHNRNGRLCFDPTVPTGYLLLNELSRIVTTFGVQMIPNTSEISKQSLYPVKLKPIVAALDALKVCLSGNFINFGVFSLFREDSLEKAIGMGVQLMLCISDAELQEFPKVSQSFFSLLEYLVNDHIAFVASLGDAVLSHFLNTIAHSLMSIDTTVAENCCLCLDYILTHLFKLLQQQQQIDSGLSADDAPRLLVLENDVVVGNGLSSSTITNCRMRHYGASKYAVWSTRIPVAEATLLNLIKPGPNQVPNNLNLLRRIMVILLSSVIQEDCRIQFSITHPLLPLILLDSEYYTQLRNRVIASLPTGRQEAVSKLFEKLMDEVEFNLAGANRDKFTQNVSRFKHALGEFIKSSSTKVSDVSAMNNSEQAHTGNTDPSDMEYFCLSSAIVEAAGLGTVL
ncbi:Exportin 7 [Clonorchis sinensis]|uniref:Exportin 7 n=1 Tax=Clonorchis sinensis TaxID=79923 RepID=A0A8T1MCZ2_CLOSI|nr:Exportin 7 [Clonorchis sinensis]